MSKETDFIAKIAPIVQKYAPKYHISVCSAIIGQAVLESSSGTSELAKVHNYFGLKYKTNLCPTCNGVYVKEGTEQLSDGSYVKKIMQWMKFSNMENGVVGYFDFTNTSRYSNLKNVTSPEIYLINIKNDKYATQKDYVQRVMKVVNTYNLTKYDKGYNDKVLYKVQVGAFKNLNTAKELIKYLSTYGFNAIVYLSNNWYKVQVGAYSVESNALEVSKKLKQIGFFPIIIKDKK